MFIASVQMPLTNAHADVSSEARGLNFGLRLYPDPYLVYARSECSSLSAHMRRLA